MSDPSDPAPRGIEAPGATEAPGSAFSADYRVRFDEAGPDGRIRTSTLLRYAQDVAWRHSEARGFDRPWYAARGLSWVARSVSLELLAAIGMGQTLHLTTRVIGHRRIWARRLAEAREGPGARGDILARVVTDWVILDLRGRPVRIPPDFGLDFASPEVHGDIQHAEPPAGEPSASLSIRVRPHDLDPVGHVNNAAYLDWLEEAHLAAGHAPAVGALPRTMVLEYLASAGLGDVVEVATWHGRSSWQARMTDRDSTVLRASGRAGLI
ncbi:MAG TPA: thioesterase family protein [Candidatus Limnocylindrales bacterium]|nr:thioesterase family protein [Candidatus Limnocylindrales bacterium]